jgi:hypothetical protein
MLLRAIQDTEHEILRFAQDDNVRLDIRIRRGVKESFQA